VLQHIRETGSAQNLVGSNQNNGLYGGSDGDEVETTPNPVLVGLSVSLGYLIGGVLPLAPYFFASDVADGLWWSFAICVVALFVFGSAKALWLGRPMPSSTDDAEGSWSTPAARSWRARIPFKALRDASWEGIQMVVLGTLAALAAVLCVRIFQGVGATNE
jgi:VIT1/CCC1 family predicted Fe2+/Mn2+ transporter